MNSKPLTFGQVLGDDNMIYTSIRYYPFEQQAEIARGPPFPIQIRHSGSVLPGGRATPATVAPLTAAAAPDAASGVIHAPQEAQDMTAIYRTQPLGEVEVFYREAGPSDAPVILLLHGFPTAGHMFRDLIPLLADRYRVIAPDLPGFGNTKAPPRGRFELQLRRPRRR